LAIVTLSLAFTADRFLYRWTPLVGRQSVRPLARPEVADEVVHGLAGSRAYAWMAIGAFLLTAVAVAAIRRARTGAALTALRGSEAAASAMAFSPMAARLRGFALSGFIAGTAGVLFAGLTGSASSAPFDTTRSITLLAYAVIAGAGSVPGAILGGGIVTLSTLSFGASGVGGGGAGSATTLATGVALVAVLLVAPTGLAGLAARARGRWAARAA
jgi:branched-chain amino acid transport system permease protein